MRRFYSYIIRKALFLFIIGVWILFIAPSISNIFLANIYINGLIISVFLIGVVYSFYQTMSLNHEVAWMEQFQTSRHYITSSKTPNLLAPLAQLIKDPKSLSLHASMIRTLLDSIQDRLHDRRTLSKYLIGSLVFIGLIGTFWGLLQTVGSIGNVIQQLDGQSGEFSTMFQKLKSGLQAPMSGMAVAFSSSLFGLAGSLILGFLELQSSQAESRFYQQLEDWLSQKAKLPRTDLSDSLPVSDQRAIPDYIHALLEQSADRLYELQSSMKDMYEQQNKLHNETHNLASQLLLLTDQMRAQQTLYKQLTDHQMQWQPIMTEMTDAIKDLKSDDIESNHKHYNRLESALLQLIEETKQSRDDMGKNLHQEIKLLARTMDRADETI